VLARFEAELELVNIIVRQLRRDVGQVLDDDELLSFGQEGLLLAARRFDPERGVPFRRFANYRVRGAIIDGMRSHGALPRRAHEKLRALQAAQLVAEGFHEDTAAAIRGGLLPEAADERIGGQLAAMATAMAIGLGAPAITTSQGEQVLVDETADPETSAERKELLRIVREQIAELPPQEAALVQRHFFQDQQIDQISADLGLSKSWGCRILARAVSRLTQHMLELTE
jgi:RNA polymerase sigma factor for flagellar operon FliA